MKIKKALALIMALVLALSAGQFGVVHALETSNYVKEAGTIVQRSTAAPPTVAASYTSPYASTAARSQGDSHNTSWAYAAVAALEARAQKSGLPAPNTFSEGHMFFALSSDSNNPSGFDRRYNGPGNRNMVTAYLMRTLQGGPVSNYPTSPTQTSIPSMADFSAITKDRYVSGVTYIPSLPVTADAAARALFMARVKAAVSDNGAVAASLYMDMTRLYDRKNGTGKVYYYAGTAAADHTVAIVGWDDAVTVDVSVTTGTAENPVVTTTTYTGAFLVRDSLVGSGSTYWVSYDVALSGLYFIEGFNDNELFEASYEYDTFGFTNATGFNASTAWYANVFTSATAAEQLKAVSLFLTGENTGYEVYYIANYTETKDLTKGLTPANLIASGTKALPGYYTVPIGGKILMPAKGKKCAIVVKVTNPYDTSPIPVQATPLYKTGNVGRSYISSNGDSWLDAYAQNQSVVCLKAHVDKDIDIPLTGVTVPQTEDKVTTIGGVDYLTLYVAPGQSYYMGPLFQPLNATDVAKDKTEWYLGDENASNWARVPATPPALAEGEDEPALTVNASTGMMKVSKEHTEGTYSVKIKVENEAGVSYTAIGIVSIRAVAIDKIELDKKTLSLKAGSTAALKLTITPADASKHTVTWKVAKDYNSATNTYTPFDYVYDAAEPYRAGGPLVSVTDGKVTAIMDGTCYVYAEVTQDNAAPIRSEPCAVTIDKVASTGVTISKKAVTMTAGTKMTLVAAVKPATASNKKVTWSSSDSTVVGVDVNLGILDAKKEGTAVIKATNATGQSFECTVTVNEMPSVVLGRGKSTTLSLLGAGAKDDVKWEFIPVQDAENPLESDFFTATQSSARLKVTGKEVGGELLRAYVTAESYDENGDLVSSRVIREQTWRVETVIPVTKLEFRSDTDAIVKKATLSVDPKNASRNMSMTLTVSPAKPLDATNLGYSWISKNPDIVSVTVDPTQPDGSRVVLQARKAGSTKITATSHNGKKKITITVKVLEFPAAVTLSKPGPMSLAVGKSLSVRGKVNTARNVNKEIRYFVEDGGGNAARHTDADPIATVNDKGKVVAVREGKVKVMARGAPFDNMAASAALVVDCKVLVTGVSLSLGATTLVSGETTVITAGVAPADATARGVKLSLSNPALGTLTDNGDGTWTLTARSPGSGKITAVSTDNPKKSKSVSFTVRAP